MEQVKLNEGQNRKKMKKDFISFIFAGSRIVRGEVSFRERVSTFSLRSTKIGSSVCFGTRDIAPLVEGYTRVPESESFVKLVM